MGPGKNFSIGPVELGSLEKLLINRTVMRGWIFAFFRVDTLILSRFGSLRVASGMFPGGASIRPKTVKNSTFF
jgi:hypothetical protein